MHDGQRKFQLKYNTINSTSFSLTSPPTTKTTNNLKTIWNCSFQAVVGDQGEQQNEIR